MEPRRGSWRPEGTGLFMVSRVGAVWMRATEMRLTSDGVRREKVTVEVREARGAEVWVAILRVGLVLSSVKEGGGHVRGER